MFSGIIATLILVAAAVIPAAFLMKKVYDLDHLEKESRSLMKSLIIAGFLAAIPAVLAETIFPAIMDAVLPQESVVYQFLMNFGVIALSEEGSKYYFLKRKTWKNPEFNCQFDGIVYAVFVSLGFALLENILYVLPYGLGVALGRALTSIPGHASFGVFMGAFYGIARKEENLGHQAESKSARKSAVLIPVLLHGAYDFTAMYRGGELALFFLLFIILLFIYARKLVKKTAQEDSYI